MENEGVFQVKMMTYTNKTQPTKISPEKYLKENFKGKENIQKEAIDLKVLKDVVKKSLL